jgi:hypothetical protein
MLIPVLVLGAMAGGSAGTPHSNGATDGEQSELEHAVLSDPAINLTQSARGDIEAGRVDSRVLHVLLLLAQSHELGPVGPFVTGHSFYVKGTTRVSNHVYGRAVDILGVGDEAVSPTNEGARAVMVELLALSEPLVPDEVGGPWIVQVGGRTSFTNADHQDHIHLGYDS